MGPPRRSLRRIVDPAEAPDVDERVLVLAATNRDATLTSSLLTSSGITNEICASFAELLQRMAEGGASAGRPGLARVR